MNVACYRLVALPFQIHGPRERIFEGVITTAGVPIATAALGAFAFLMSATCTFHDCPWPLDQDMAHGGHSIFEPDHPQAPDEDVWNWLPYLFLPGRHFVP